ncbi:hypothetical protein [Streptomyces sp. E5N91]|uniref:hypothetical protein n=1 Tax=Streptomyces sp. E5N91 TaxID=1851996 RepID=UPI001291208B|nr:hypothetical protein [Streptomyces sp. E5N91]
MTTSSQTLQLSPATALVQLLSEHPELPGLFWSISPDGWFSGGLHEDDVDARAVMAQYVVVLGGKPTEMRRPAQPDETGPERYATILQATWRDVPFYLSMGCNAAALAETAQVSA